MRVSVTERRDPSAADLRSAGELAPDLALPWVVKLRYGLLAGQAALILGAHFLFGVELPILWLAVPLALTAASNLLSHRIAAALGPRPGLGSLLALDTLCLTALLALTGGAANPFSLLYLVQITLSAVVLSRAWTWGLGALSVASFGFLFPVHARLRVFEAHHTSEGFSVHLVGMWIAFAAGALVITIFIGKVSEVLRRREEDLRALQDQLARHQRIGSIATLAAGAAHALGTPLGTIAVAAKDLELYARDPEVAGEARLIRSEVDRCRDILQQMSARGAEPVGEALSVVPLRDLLDRVRQSLPAPDRDRVKTRVDGAAAEAVLPADAARQALTALVKNALEAGGGQAVTLAAEELPGRVSFTVQDSGSGMDRETLGRIAEPFFTTKEPGKGMGLGTFLVRAFAQKLNGSLSFESEPGHGTKAILELPQAEHDREITSVDRR